MKRSKYTAVCVAVLAGFALVAEAGRKDEITLLMVPREEEAVRLGMDIHNRYPSLLISYRLGADNRVSLHGWTGSQWVNVTAENFAKGAFFKNGPDSAVVIEKAGAPVPEALIPPADWCSEVSRITTTDIRPLLHLIGQYYDFSYDDWKWSARRYNLEMDAVNPEGLNVAWYHRPMSEHFKSRPKKGSTDLQYWVSVRRPAPPAEPAAAAEAVPVAEEAAGEPDNPLTNDVPEAVVLGPADADASVDEAAPGGDAAAEPQEAPETEPAEAEAPAAGEEEPPAKQPQAAEEAAAQDGTEAGEVGE